MINSPDWLATMLSADTGVVSAGPGQLEGLDGADVASHCRHRRVHAHVPEQDRTQLVLGLDGGAPSAEGRQLRRAGHRLQSDGKTK